jgi:hypothetical protein
MRGKARQALDVEEKVRLRVLATDIVDHSVGHMDGIEQLTGRSDETLILFEDEAGKMDLQEQNQIDIAPMARARHPLG